MASYALRKGRWTAQVRMKGFPSAAKTFDTKEEAERWARWYQGEVNRLRLNKANGSDQDSIEAAAIKARLPAEVAGLRRNKISRNPVVYFLFQGDECVYVGQTVNLQSRLVAHISNGIQFDSYSHIECEHDQLAATELKYIGAIMPKLNTIGAC